MDRKKLTPEEKARWFSQQLEKMCKISNLPSLSGIILSEPLSKGKIVSFNEEINLMKRMGSFLQKECGAKRVYVKYHHSDSVAKKRIVENMGFEEITSPYLCYELLHPLLKPDWVVSVCSSALFYCSLFGGCGKLISFSQGIKL